MGENTALVEGLVSSNEQNWKKGEKQPSAFKDVPFAILFYAQVIAMIGVAVVYGPDTLNDITKDVTPAGTADITFDYTGYLYAAGSLGLLSFMVSALMMLIMVKFASFLVKMSLLFSVFLSFIFAVSSLFSGSIFGGILGFVFFLCSVCYARAVWSRIPFATANLEASLTAINANFGITFVSFFFVVMTFVWSILWAVVAIITYDKTKVCDATGSCTIGFFPTFLLLVSLYWTQQVIMNTVHVTVSGVVGTWWFVPEEASSFCSSAVTSSLARSTTYSFGSICLGSLIVAIIQALREIANQAREQGRQNGDGAQILACIAECILGCIQSIVEYFNKWAYVYVGIYGYKYIEAGKNVMALFTARGWEVVIADDLVGNTIFLVTLITSLLMGGIGILVELSTDWFIDAGDSAQIVAFAVGFFIGFLLCSIMFNVVSSAVNATIVLFAEAPSEFQANHPELSNQMRMAYVDAYPGLF